MTLFNMNSITHFVCKAIELKTISKKGMQILSIFWLFIWNMTTYGDDRVFMVIFGDNICASLPLKMR